MVEHPLEEMKQWIIIPNVFRALFHLEALDSPEDCIDFATEHSWQKGLVINPDTPLYRAESYFSLLDVIQFMTVHPGRQGQDFIPEVGEKIRAFTKQEKRPLCAVDGAVNKNTIKVLKSWGVEIFNVGSALTKATDIQHAYTELKNLL
jgi:ribulose-phosphate 3-epimerase